MSNLAILHLLGQGHQRTEDVVIFEGTFSWWAAWCMMIWVPRIDFLFNWGLICFVSPFFDEHA